MIALHSLQEINGLNSYFKTMSDDSPSNFRAMSVKRIFRESFAIYRETWRQLIGIVAPCSILTAAAHFFIFGLYDDLTYTSADSSVRPTMLLFAGIIIFLSYAGTALGVIAISERFAGGTVSIANAHLRIANLLFPLLGTLIFASIATVAGLFTFVIPGLVVYGWFCLAPAVVTIEGEGGIGALKRSYVIVKGYWNKAFFLVVLMAILQLIVASIVLLLPSVIGASVGIAEVFKYLSILSPLLIIEPFKIATTTLLYYDLRIRKEGYTIQTMADEIGALS